MSRLALLLLATLLACGGETASSGSPAAPTACRDTAEREDSTNLVVCEDHARIEREDGWILCRCAP